MKVSVVFTTGELWFLHSFIRHEMEGEKGWKYPPACQELNDKIAMALDTCESYGDKEAELELGETELYAIDFHIRADMEDARGYPMGKTVLLKTFRARKEISIREGIVNVPFVSKEEWDDARNDARTYQDTGSESTGVS